MNQLTRPSPSAHASSELIGSIKKGNNGAYWIVLHPVHRWVELTQKPTITRFQCLYNGETNRVFIGDKRIFIFHVQEDHTVALAYIIPKYTRYWAASGSWVVPPKTKQKGYKGCTVLVEVKPKHYIYIDGRVVQSFTTDSPILKYDSPMGNSFVPYGYAHTKERTYLMLEAVWRPYLSKGDPYDAEAPTTSFPMKTLFDAWHKQ